MHIGRNNTGLLYHHVEGFNIQYSYEAEIKVGKSNKNPVPLFLIELLSVTHFSID